MFYALVRRSACVLVSYTEIAKGPRIINFDFDFYREKWIFVSLSGKKDNYIMTFTQKRSLFSDEMRINGERIIVK